MSALIATYSSGAALLEGLHSFLIVGHTLAPSFTGTGTGYCDDAIGTSSSVQEVITATFTSSTAFTVSGSISGAMGSGTVNTLFTHARFKATIQVGSVAWVAGDTITWTITAPWAILNYVSGQSYIYQAPGNDGTRQVNIGWTVQSNVSGGYYGARIGAYPTWVSNTFQWRPWNVCWWPLGVFSGSSIKLFVRVSGQFVYAVARVGTYYMSMCAGLYDALGTWDQQPYPYMVGGCYSWSSEPAVSSANWLYSTILSPTYTSGVSPLVAVDPSQIFNKAGGSLFIRTPCNFWQTVEDSNYDAPMAVNAAYPILGSLYMDRSKITFCLDGTIPAWPYPINVCGGLPPTTTAGIPTASSMFQGLLGYMPFVKLIPPYDNSSNLLVAESTMRVSPSRTNHIVMQAMNDSSANSLYALEMV